MDIGDWISWCVDYWCGADYFGTRSQGLTENIQLCYNTHMKENK